MRDRILITALEMVGTTPFDCEQWCGKFVLHTLHKCGLAKHIDYTDKTGQTLCFNLIKTINPTHSDIVKLQFKDIKHYAIIIKVSPSNLLDKKRTILTVDGGSFDDTVSIKSHTIRENTEFYSINTIL
jgi:hypothetical protein